jgi:hypothetical protein
VVAAARLVGCGAPCAISERRLRVEKREGAPLVVMGQLQLVDYHDFTALTLTAVASTIRSLGIDKRRFMAMESH